MAGDVGCWTPGLRITLARVVVLQKELDLSLARDLRTRRAGRVFVQHKDN